MKTTAIILFVLLFPALLFTVICTGDPFSEKQKNYDLLYTSLDRIEKKERSVILASGFSVVNIFFSKPFNKKFNITRKQNL